MHTSTYTHVKESVIGFKKSFMMIMMMMMMMMNVFVCVHKPQLTFGGQRTAQLTGVASLLAWGLNSGHEAWQQVP